MPIFTSAPTEPNETSSSVGLAPVSIVKSRAVIVSTEPSVTFIVSALNLNALTSPCVELERRARRPRCRAVRPAVPRLGGQAVGDRRRDRLAGQELRAAGGEVDRAAERRRRVRRSVTVKSIDADAQVVELEDAAEARSSAGAVGGAGGRAGGGVAGRRRRPAGGGRLRRRLARACSAARRGRAGSRRSSDPTRPGWTRCRSAGDGRDHAGDAEARELDQRGLERAGSPAAALVLRRVVVRVVGDPEAAAR